MKKLLKQLLAVTTAIMMAITLLPVMANAENAAEVQPASPTTTIDYEKKGSITINKTTAIKDRKTTPLPGAEFTIYKIATLTADSTETSKLEKKLSVTVNKKTYNTIGSLLNLDSATQKEVASKFADKVKNQEGITKEARKTGDGENGTTKGQCKFENLAVGYYLVVETETPIVKENGKDTIQYVASTPFFVAIPQSNQTTAYDEEAKEATTAWEYNVVATPKNEEVSIDKKIVEDATNKDKDTVAVGDTINYEITSTSPKYTAEYFDYGEGEEKTNPTYNILDTLSDGLTLNTLNDDGSIQADSIKVFVNGTELASQTKDEKTTWYTLSPTKDEKTKKTIGFKIQFTPDFLKKEEYKGATVKVKYSVTVNENAVVGTDGNTNDVKLEYTRKPGDSATGVPGKTTPTVYTYGLVVKKVDGKDNNILLSGAEFKLYKVEKVKVENENGEVEEKETETQITNLKGMTTTDTYITGNTGVVTLDGLDVGTYRLEEVKAPKDYTLLKDKIEFTITDADPDGVIDGTSSEKFTINKDNKGQLTTTITNNKGFNLPSTGGMGTYIFTIGGLVVMAGAVLLLVSSKKKRA